MPTFTLNPTANTTPDQGGTLAVTGAINTGHDSTLTSIGASDFQSEPLENNSQATSARWSSFQAAPPGLISLKLKFDWAASGVAEVDVSVAGSGSASASFVVQYSIDGGSNWITVVNRSVSASQAVSGSDSESDPGPGGSVEVVLSPTQNISLVQVRDRMDAHASANAPNTPGADVISGANYTGSVSGIRLEAETQNQTHMLVMM
jgi:hypothetical protein